MPEQVNPDDVHTEEDTDETSVSCIVVTLGPLQLTLERLVRNVLVLALATLLLGCAVMVAQL